MSKKSDSNSKKTLTKSLFSTLTNTEINLIKEHRCLECNKLLGVDNFLLPALEIKCVRCGSINSVLKNMERQIIITDVNGIIMFVNEQVEKVTGYKAKEILGNKPSLWGKQMPKKFYKKMWNDIVKKKKAVSVQLTNRHKKGTLYKVVLRISPILNIEGDVEFFLGIETIMRDSKSK